MHKVFFFVLFSSSFYICYDLVCFGLLLVDFGLILVPDKFQEIEYLSFYSDGTAYRDWLGVRA
jgi:hypothetical protein